YCLKRAIKFSRVHDPMPLPASGVMLEERTTEPSGNWNSRPPANSLPSIMRPLSTWVWHSTHPPAVVTYLPYAIRSEGSGFLVNSAGCGMVLIIKFMGKSAFDSGTAFSIGGKVLR